MSRQTYLGMAVCFLSFSLHAVAQDKESTNPEPIFSDPKLRLGSGLFRTPGHIGASAISPDGKEIAIYKGSNSITVMSVETGKEVRSFPVTEYLRNNQIFFHPDGKSLLSGGYNGIHRWNILDGKNIRTIPPVDKDRRDGYFSVSDDGGTVSVPIIYQNAYVKVLSLKDGSELATVKPLHNNNLFSALSPDGSFLATWGNHYPPGPQVTPQERAIPRCVHIWDCKTTKLIATIDTESPYVSGCRFAPNGKQIAVCGNGVIRLCEIASGKTLRQFACRLGNGMQGVFCFSKDGKRLAYSSGRGSVQIWETETGKRVGQCQVPINMPANLIPRDDGTFLAWGTESTSIVIWEAPSGKLLTPMLGHRSPPAKLFFSRDGKQLTGIESDSRFVRWNLADGKEADQDRSTAQTNQLGQWPVLIAPNGKYLVGSSSEGGGVSLWETKQNIESFSLTAKHGPIDRGGLFAFSADSTRIAGMARHNNPEDPPGVPIWDIESGTLINTLKGQKGDFTSVHFSTTGKVLSTSSYSYVPTGGMTVEIWSRDIETGKVLSKIQVPNQQIAFSAFLDERCFVLSSNAYAKPKIYDAFTGQEAGTLAVPEGMIYQSINNSPDTRLFALCAKSSFPNNGFAVERFQSRVFVFEAASKSLRQTIRVPGEAVSVAFSSDNKQLAVGLADTTIQVFDLESRQSIEILKDDSVEILWNKLEDPMANNGWKAMRQLIAKPKLATKLIQEKLSATVVKTVDPKQIAKWIANLDSPRYAVREQAMKELVGVIAFARPAINAELDKKSISLEMRERLEKLTESFEKPAVEAGILRPLRAIEILERINDDDARKHLKVLAAGGDSSITRAARAAIARIENP